MDIETLTRFFMWCTIVNGAMLILWAVIVMLAMDLVYRLHSKWFCIPRATFDVLMYSFLGLFKMFFLVFNAVPYVVLLIIR